MRVAPCLDMHTHKLCSAIIVLALGLAGSARGATVHVDGGSLQAAIDASADGDIILVAEGSYGPVAIRGRRIELHGGYTGAFIASDPVNHVTEIRGDESRAAITIEDAPAVVIDGFHITGGRRGISSTAWPPAEHTTTITDNVIYDNHVAGLDEPGGGIRCDNHTVIRGNVIRGNSAGWGAAIAAATEDAALVIDDNLIEDNIGTGDHGGGIHAAGATVQITNNVIRRNSIGRDSGYGWGGGLTVYGLGTTAQIANNIVYDNNAPTAGSGIFVDDEANATIDHTLVYGNGCTEYGGAGIYVDGLDSGHPSFAKLTNVTVADHACGGDGNGVFVEQDSRVSIDSSIFWNNGDDFFTDATARIDMRYSLSSEPLAGTGNITGDPLFADPRTGDYHLRSTHGRWHNGTWVVDDQTSPGIAAGAPDDSGLAVNMGVYGGTPQASKRGDASTNTDPTDDPPRVVGCHAGNGAAGSPVTLILVMAWMLRKFIRRDVAHRGR